MRIVVLFDSLGPYHVARLTELGKHCELFVIERNSISAEYEWNQINYVPFHRLTLFSHTTRDARERPHELRSAVDAAVDMIKPDVIAVPGWSSKLAISAVAWAVRHFVPVILMSDSQEKDFPRKGYREFVKRRYLGCCDAALVAGTSHMSYLVKLGFPEARIRVGYDVVDNVFFFEGATRARLNAVLLRREYNLPKTYFLTIARFVEKKNIQGVIRAFSLFLESSRNRTPDFGNWHLVILGDGPQRQELEDAIQSLGLQERVQMPGFKQYPELPIYYGLSEAFILPSMTEQWGLVVNEAMASSLPVLVSERCGSSGDLVHSGINGYLFEPFDVGALSDLMLRVADDADRRVRMGEESAKLIRDWSPMVFSLRLVELAHLVKGRKRARGRVDRLLLWLMCRISSPRASLARRLEFR